MPSMEVERWGVVQGQAAGGERRTTCLNVVGPALLNRADNTPFKKQGCPPMAEAMRSNRVGCAILSLRNKICDLYRRCGASWFGLS